MKNSKAFEFKGKTNPEFVLRLYEGQYSTAGAADPIPVPQQMDFNLPRPCIPIYVFKTDKDTAVDNWPIEGVQQFNNVFRRTAAGVYEWFPAPNFGGYMFNSTVWPNFDIISLNDWFIEPGVYSSITGAELPGHEYKYYLVVLERI